MRLKINAELNSNNKCNMLVDMKIIYLRHIIISKYNWLWDSTFSYEGQDCQGIVSENSC